MMGDAFEQIAVVVAAVDVSRLSGDVAGWSDAELEVVLRTLSRVERLAGAVKARVAAEAAARFEARRAAGERGRFRTPARAVGAVTGESDRAAAGLIAVGRATAPRPKDPERPGPGAPVRFPALGAALVAGTVSVELVRAVTGILDEVVDRVDAEVWVVAEAGLAEFAVAHSFAESVVEAKRVRDRLDAAGVARREAERRAARCLTLGAERPDGMTPVRGLLDPESAAVVRAGLDALTHPRNTATAPDVSGADGSGGATADERSYPQRAVDALVALVRRALAQGLPATGGTRPQVVITISVADLVSGRGVAHLEGSGERASVATARRQACDGEVIPAVLGTEGAVLGLGLSHRLFSVAQRRALALRDGGCVAPGCARPPGWCDAHHVEHWAEGGATDLDNAVLLCGWDHQRVHDGLLEVEMRPTAFGPRVPWTRHRRPDGTWTPWARARNPHAPDLDTPTLDEPTNAA